MRTKIVAGVLGLIILTGFEIPEGWDAPKVIQGQRVVVVSAREGGAVSGITPEEEAKYIDAAFDSFYQRLESDLGFELTDEFKTKIGYDDFIKKTRAMIESGNLHVVVLLKKDGNVLFFWSSSEDLASIDSTNPTHRLLKTWGDPNEGGFPGNRDGQLYFNAYRKSVELFALFEQIKRGELDTPIKELLEALKAKDATEVFNDLKEGLADVSDGQGLITEERFTNAFNAFKGEGSNFTKQAFVETIQLWIDATLLHEHFHIVHGSKNEKQSLAYLFSKKEGETDAQWAERKKDLLYNAGLIQEPKYREHLLASILNIQFNEAVAWHLNRMMILMKAKRLEDADAVQKMLLFGQYLLKPLVGDQEFQKKHGVLRGLFGDSGKYPHLHREQTIWDYFIGDALDSLVAAQLDKGELKLIDDKEMRKRMDEFIDHKGFQDFRAAMKKFEVGQFGGGANDAITGMELLMMGQYFASSAIFRVQKIQTELGLQTLEEVEATTRLQVSDDQKRELESIVKWIELMKAHRRYKAVYESYYPHFHEMVEAVHKIACKILERAGAGGKGCDEALQKGAR